MIRCACGRLAKSYGIHGNKRSRSSRNRNPKSQAGHHMCFQCWTRECDRFRAAGLKGVYDEVPVLEACA